MIKFVTDVRPGEKEFPPETFSKPLKVVDLDGKELETRQQPDGGWSHDKLLEVAQVLGGITTNGADAFLGDVWVGSTEV